MARTPVTTTEEVEQPKRTPVVEETLIEKGATLGELMAAAQVGIMDAQPRATINPIIDGFRVCARPDCGSSFQPKSTRITDTDATEYYCSSDCAIAEFYRKRNLGPVPVKIERGAESSARAAVKVERTRERIEKSAAAETKQGPLRAIKEVLSTKKGSKRVRYECGHEGSVGSRANRGRCRKCRVGPVEAAKEESNGRVAVRHRDEREHVSEVRSTARQPVSRPIETSKVRPTRRAIQDGKSISTKPVSSGPVKRQPVTRSTVKPPKRGKKGKK